MSFCYLVAGVGFVCPPPNHSRLVSVAGSLLMLLDLAVSAAKKRRPVAFFLAYPLPPPEVAVGKPLRNEKRESSPQGTAFSFLARSTEKDITGFFEKSACDKAFSDFFYIFSCSM